MANLNKVMLIGRLTRDPEVRTFSTGGKVAKFGFAVNNRRKNPQTGQWEDEAVFLDIEAFNRGENGRQADLVEQYLKKGHLAYIEGHLQLDQWTGQDGQKRSKLKIVLDNLQFLQPRTDGSTPEGGMRSAREAPAPRASMASSRPSNSFDEQAPEPESFEASGGRGSDEEIPF
jgi:single-strand DNA-binding protein